MATTKFDIASAALIMLGAEPVASFDAGGTAEQVACNHLYQTCLEQWLSLHPWRFATRTQQLSRRTTAPSTLWAAAYQQPADMLSLQAVLVGPSGTTIPFDRFEDDILCDAAETDVVYGVFTYEPPVVRWPGYFVALMELAVAHKLAFALAGKIDLKVNLEAELEQMFRLAKNADSRQQTTRRLPVAGRGSIIEARRS